VFVIFVMILMFHAAIVAVVVLPIFLLLKHVCFDPGRPECLTGIVRAGVRSECIEALRKQHRQSYLRALLIYIKFEVWGSG